MTNQYKRINGRMQAVDSDPVFKSAAQIQQELNMKEVSIEVDVTKVGAVNWRQVANKAWRTFYQAFIGAITVTLPTALVSPDIKDWPAAMLSAAVSALIAGVAAAAAVTNNALEDKGIIKDRKVQ